MLMTPLYWLYLGVGLIIFEAMTPGLVSVFFGLSALTVGLIVLFVPLPQGVQWLCFSALSVVYLVLLRRSLKRVFNGKVEVSAGDPDDAFTGKRAVVLEAIAPKRPGRVEFNGCAWTAESDAEVPAGASVRIRGKNNLTLNVEAL